ncbi:MAG: hypothetical protein JNK04_05715 [Myxococcales bacterium]|nr:hypothetical protein [Myxococcales bacterium]
MVLVLTSGDIVWDPAVDKFDEVRTSALGATTMSLYKSEPLYVDLRWARDAAAIEDDPRWQAALINVASVPLSMEKDEVLGVDALERKRALRYAWSAAIVLALLLCVAIGTSILAIIARQRAVALAESEARARDRAETVVDHLAYDLPDVLGRVGAPRAMQGTAKKIEEYYLQEEGEGSVPTPDQRRRRLAGWNALGNSRFQGGELDSAAEGFSRSLRLAESLRREKLDDDAVARDVFVAHYGLSGVHMRRDDWAAARTELEEAERELDELLTRDPKNANWRLDRANTLIRRVEVARHENDSVVAGSRLASAVELLKALIAEDPANLAVRTALVKAQDLHAAGLDPSEKAAELVRVNHETNALIEAAADAEFDARWIDLRSQAVMNRTERSTLQSIRQVVTNPERSERDPVLPLLRKLYSAAARELSEACSDRELLALLDRKNSAMRQQEVMCRLTMASLGFARGDLQQATEALGRAWSAQQDVEKEFSQLPNVASDGVLILDLGALVERQRGNLDASLEYYGMSRERSEALAKRSPNDPIVRRDLAAALINEATIEVDRGDFARAGSSFEKALKACEGLDDGICKRVRQVAKTAPRARGPTPLTYSFQVAKVSGLEQPLTNGSPCHARVWPPAEGSQGCHRAVVSCGNLRLLGADANDGLLALRAPQGASEASCPSRTTLDLSTGALHIDESNLLGTYVVDAVVAKTRP